MATLRSPKDLLNLSSEGAYVPIKLARKLGCSVESILVQGQPTTRNPQAVNVASSATCFDVPCKAKLTCSLGNNHCRIERAS